MADNDQKTPTVQNSDIGSGDGTGARRAFENVPQPAPQPDGVDSGGGGIGS